MQAMDAWAKSGAEGAAERAQQIHNGMAQIYAASGDPTMRPTTGTYNILIEAHGRRSDAAGLHQAEQILREMIDSSDNATTPNTVSFNTLLGAYARSNTTKKAVARASELMDLMEELKLSPTAATFTALQAFHVYSDRPDAPQKALEVLQMMLLSYGKGNLMAKPSVANYNGVLTAISRKSNRQSAEIAAALLERMESEECLDVKPDRMSYALAILACARSNDDLGVRKAEELLLRMEARAEKDDKKRKEVSSAAPASVVLDAECFNVVLTALSKSRNSDAVDRSIAIMDRMKAYAAAGHDDIQPSLRSWNAMLNSLSRSKVEHAAAKAEEIVNHLFELHKKGVPNVKPNAYSFTAVLHAFQKSKDLASIQRADHILRWMEKLFEEGELESPPDVFHYTICINAWTNSDDPVAPERVVQILGHMLSRAKNGCPGAKPNSKTYRSVLNFLAKRGQPGEAEGLLDYLIRLAEQGENHLNEHTFNSLITSFCRSRIKGSSRSAEAVLEKMLDFSQVHQSCKPDTRSFTNIILHYKISTAPDAPYRAEYLFNRLIALFKAGDRSLEPDNFAVETTINAWSSAKHPDSGTTADRILKQIQDLRINHAATKATIDRTIIDAVLIAWCVSGDKDAGQRAEYHLDYMERKYAAGHQELKPYTRCYGLVLNAWSKSTSFEKGRRALGVLKRMEQQERNGNTDVRTSVVAYSYVINACAFTSSSPDVEEEAFHIAINLMDKMLMSSDCQPTSLTYGWFIQACGRLRASSLDLKKKEEQLERAWTLCCEKGLVTPFVLQRFTGAASESLYQRLLQPVLKKLKYVNGTKEELKFKVSPGDLPLEWTANIVHNDNGENNPRGMDWA
jgi:Pentatricopeptide repeat domain/PPR repeat